MDPILFIRQMMAESKFLEAQKQAESVLLNVKSSERSEIIFLYLEILSALNKHHPIELLLEAAEVLINTDVDKAQYWLSLIGNEHSSIYKKRIELLKIRIADKKGNLDEVYRLILNYQIHLFEHKAPTQVEAIQTFIEKYFKSDFNLKLHELAIQGMLCNLTAAERITRELIFSCSERSSSKGKLDKLSAIRDVLTTIKDKKHLEIYQNYCSILISSKGDKYDLKKLVEFVIYFDDFKFQIHILSLLSHLGLNEAAQEYSLAIKQNSEFDFVYIEKYFQHLKTFFVKKQQQDTLETHESMTPDLSLEESSPEQYVSIEKKSDMTEEESLLLTSLSYQNFSFNDFLELAICFLQAEFPRAAIKACDLALRIKSSDKDFLKATYLKLIALCKLPDYRAALDLSLLAIEKATTQDEILSLLYVQADTYLKLGQKQHAKHVFQKIHSIDSSYRLTKERLLGLNEI